MQLIIASNNTHKINEIKTLFQDLNLTVFPYSQVFDNHIEALEDGQTFEENALKKVKAFAPHPDHIYLSDDSGLVVDALDGRPGIHSARYGGPGATSTQQCEKILEEMALKNKRAARFVCVIALLFPTGDAFTVSGIVEGTIANTIKGQHGFGYDPIFIPEGFDKTFSELGQAIKNSLSHRSRALKAAFDRLKHL